MPQLAIRELRPRFNPRQDLPAHTAQVFILELHKVMSERLADLHLEFLTFGVHLWEALVVRVSVLLVGVVGRRRTIVFVVVAWAAAAEFTAELKDALYSRVISLDWWPRLGLFAGKSLWRRGAGLCYTTVRIVNAWEVM